MVPFSKKQERGKKKQQERILNMKNKYKNESKLLKITINLNEQNKWYDFLSLHNSNCMMPTRAMLTQMANKGFKQGRDKGTLSEH